MECINNKTNNSTITNLDIETCTLLLPSINMCITINLAMLILTLLKYIPKIPVIITITHNLLFLEHLLITLNLSNALEIITITVEYSPNKKVS